MTDKEFKKLEDEYILELMEPEHYFYVESQSLSKILELEINCEDYSLRDFNTNHRNFIDFFYINNIMFRTLYETIYYYYNDKKYNMDDDINVRKDIRIKFNSGDYLLFDEALEMIQNIFLSILHNEILLKFYSHIIFYTTKEDLKQNGIYTYIEQGNINYSALIFFIQTDWKKINISLIKAISRDEFTIYLKINPFFNNLTETKQSINQIFKLTGQIKINNKDKIDKFARLRRLLCLSWIIDTHIDCSHRVMYKELLKRDHRYSEYVGIYDEKDSYSAESSEYIKQIKADLKLIKKIKKIGLLQNISKNVEINNFDTLYECPF